VATVRLLVTGANGLLGAAVVSVATAGRSVVIAATRRDADVRDGDAVLRLVGEARPDAVVHCAYARDDEEAIVRGSANVARAAASVDARLVHLSSDRVFRGRAEPYTEGHRTDPIDPYGAAKARAEEEVTAACPSAVLVRTSLLWRLDPPSASVQAVLDALAGTTSTAFFVDELRCPNHVDDLAAACVQLAARSDLEGPLHLAGSEAVSRYDLARRVAAALGRDPSRIRPGRQADHASPRPPAIILDSSRAAQLMGWSPRPLPGVRRHSS
jgi:dTDP-4-dehydrorhamnose reductase